MLFFKTAFDGIFFQVCQAAPSLSPVWPNLIEASFKVEAANEEVVGLELFVNGTLVKQVIKRPVLKTFFRLDLHLVSANNGQYFLSILKSYQSICNLRSDFWTLKI